MAEFHVEESTLLANAVFKADERSQVPDQPQAATHVTLPASQGRAAHVVEDTTRVTERGRYETQVLLPNYSFGEAPPQFPGG